ncbi:MAG: hypothetical protein JW862_00820 [Anaerolineales bacterium]|nr:hypothetical protein [Anaerolineales bacterium]
MNWREYFIKFFRNAILTTLAIVVVLGLIGLLIAGQEGMLNGASWGLVLSLISWPFMGFFMYGKYWSDYAGRFGSWWVNKESKGDDS